MTNQIIIEQLVVGRDSLDELNKEVNDYITKGYQPKDPMITNRFVDGQQYRYLQTLVKYIPDPNPDDLGSIIVKYIKTSGADILLDQIDEDTWKKFWDIFTETVKEAMEE